MNEPGLVKAQINPRAQVFFHASCADWGQFGFGYRRKSIFFPQKKKKSNWKNGEKNRELKNWPIFLLIENK